MINLPMNGLDALDSLLMLGYKIKMSTTCPITYSLCDKHVDKSDMKLLEALNDEVGANAPYYTDRLSKLGQQMYG